MGKKFWIIFLKSIGLFAAGAALGYLFYFFFKEQSAYIIERFKVLVYKMLWYYVFIIDIGRSTYTTGATNHFQKDEYNLVVPRPPHFSC